MQLTKPLGVVLEESPNGIVVASVQTGLAAQRSGVQRGDMLLAINGHDVSSVEFDSLMERISRAPAACVLAFARPTEPQVHAAADPEARSPRMGASPSRGRGSSFPASSFGGGLQLSGAGSSFGMAVQPYTVALAKPLGLILEDRDGGGVCVESLRPGGAAQGCGKVLPGDLLLSVSGRDVSGFDVDGVMELINAAAGQVLLGLSRPITAAPVSPTAAYAQRAPPASQPIMPAAARGYSSETYTAAQPVAAARAATVCHCCGRLNCDRCGRLAPTAAAVTFPPQRPALVLSPFSAPAFREAASTLQVPMEARLAPAGGVMWPQPAAAGRGNPITWGR